jgi:hypothetical protein
LARFPEIRVEKGETGFPCQQTHNKKEEDEMKGFPMSRTHKGRMVVVLALVLVAALLIPQFSWAADNPAAASFTCTGLGYAGTVGVTGHEAACSHYFDLLERYQAGQLEYHAPGR